MNTSGETAFAFPGLAARTQSKWLSHRYKQCIPSSAAPTGSPWSVQRICRGARGTSWGWHDFDIPHRNDRKIQLYSLHWEVGPAQMACPGQHLSQHHLDPLTPSPRQPNNNLTVRLYMWHLWGYNLKRLSHPSFCLPCQMGCFQTNQPGNPCPRGAWVWAKRGWVRNIKTMMTIWGLWKNRNQELPACASRAIQIVERRGGGCGFEAFRIQNLSYLWKPQTNSQKNLRILNWGIFFFCLHIVA